MDITNVIHERLQRERLKIKNEIVEMLENGFVFAPCKNDKCEQLFSSGEYCVNCEYEGEHNV